MNQIHYEYIRRRNEGMLQSIYLENELQANQPGRTSLRVRLLFLLSDILLSVGAWIRPAEMRVLIHDRSLDECAPLTNCS